MSDSLTPSLPCPACGSALSPGTRECPTCRTPETEDLPEFSQTFYQNYEPLEVLGRGGMGTVVKSRQIKLDRLVAIKILKLVEREMQERFLEEARLLAQVNHKRVIAIHDYQVDRNVPYLVCEYVEGRSLREVLDAEGPLNVEESFRFCFQILEGLAAAHDGHVIHRDVKPENILITGDRQVKLADFGLARSTRMDLRRTSSGMLIGTPSYMTPEQVLSQPTGPATDIYSTAIVLFEMLTGRLPFEGQTPFEILNHHVQTEPPSLSALRPGLPRALDMVMTQALAKKPSDRHSSARELAQALESILKSRESAVTGRHGAGAMTGAMAGETPIQETTRFRKYDTMPLPGRMIRSLSRRIQALGERPLRLPLLLPLLVAALCLPVVLYRTLGPMPSPAPPSPPARRSTESLRARRLITKAVALTRDRTTVARDGAILEDLVQSAFERDPAVDLVELREETKAWIRELTAAGRFRLARQRMTQLRIWDPAARLDPGLESRLQAASDEGQGAIVARPRPDRTRFHDQDRFSVQVFVDRSGYPLCYALDPSGERLRLYPLSDEQSTLEIAEGTVITLPAHPQLFRFDRPGPHRIETVLLPSPIQWGQHAVKAQFPTYEDACGSIDAWITTLGPAVIGHHSLDMTVTTTGS